MAKAERVPTVALHVLRERHPEVASWVEAEARRRGVVAQDVMAELVLKGWEARGSLPR